MLRLLGLQLLLGQPCAQLLLGAKSLFKLKEMRVSVEVHLGKALL